VIRRGRERKAGQHHDDVSASHVDRYPKLLGRHAATTVPISRPSDAFFGGDASAPYRLFERCVVSLDLIGVLVRPDRERFVGSAASPRYALTTTASRLWACPERAPRRLDHFPNSASRLP